MGRETVFQVQGPVIVKGNPPIHVWKYRGLGNSQETWLKGEFPKA